MNDAGPKHLYHVRRRKIATYGIVFVHEEARIAWREGTLIEVSAESEGEALKIAADVSGNAGEDATWQFNVERIVVGVERTRPDA